MAKKLINWRVIAHVVGSLLMITGFLMAFSLPFSYYFDDGMSIYIIISCLITFGTGLTSRILTRHNHNDEIKKREGYLIVALGWLSMALFGTLPYYISGSIPSIHDAFLKPCLVLRPLEQQY